jgi:hypothetical protein
VKFPQGTAERISVREIPARDSGAYFSGATYSMYVSAQSFDFPRSKSGIFDLPREKFLTFGLEKDEYQLSLS